MIQADTFSFLTELKANNSKEWFDQNRDRYQIARKNYIATVDHLIGGLAEFDPGLDGLEAKQSLFRINRDIRFSKDKNPYKTNFGAYMARGGRKSIYPGYYFHLEPGNSFIGGGCYKPQSSELAKIRASIDFSAADLRKITSDNTFIQMFEHVQGDELKTAPKGYPKDHPEIDLLRKKSFFVLKNLSDQEIENEGFIKKALEIYKALFPFNSFLNEALQD